ncbi:hypothetical protein CLIB1444_01S05732 [[Candida] jaroonii]|uniref:Uncharacterized protein n=1 Tax=[Candida] jaroonii TaxID=467808 RepID=A0ACA9Y0E9_9ASCO|nr:hypothetical protein CLIB1444_01S05732 [[Candida] jaroonii]
MFIRHHHTIFERLGDKPHRSNYRESIRKLEVYNSSRIRFQPTIQDFIAELELSRKSTQYSVKLRLPTKYHKEIFFEPLIYGILSSLRYSDNSLSTQNKTTMIREIQQKLGIEDPNMEDYSETYKELNIEHKELFNISMSCINHIRPNHSIVQWIKSITAASVTEACNSLAYLTNIPGVIIGDILLRTPRSRDELDLQVELWNQFSDSVINESHKASKIRIIFENLLDNCGRYRLYNLLEFVKTSFDLLNRGKLGYEVMVSKKSIDFFDIDKNDEYLNTLIWKLAFSQLEPKMVTFNSTTNIISTQRFLVSKLNLKSERPNISFQGRLGIILALSVNHKTQARQMLKHIEYTNEFEELRNGNSELKNQYNFVKLMTCDDYDELLDSFHKCHETSLLWLGFIKKLQEFELLTSDRSIKILKMLSEKSLVTQTILDHLFVHLRSYKDFKSAWDIMKTNGMLNHYMQFLKLEYMMILYSKFYHHDAEISTLLLPGIKEPKNSIAIARMIYKISKTKNMYYIGKMLRGESRLNPSKMYELYQKEVINKNFQPNEDCLIALIKSSMSLNKTGEPHLWSKNLYAPQIAIHEVKNHVSINKLHENPVAFTDSAWISYIEMLKQFEYISELADIIKHWQNIKFVPQSKTLISLLSSLPIEYSHRYINHAEKVRADSKTDNVNQRSIINWPWPSINELK